MTELIGYEEEYKTLINCTTKESPIVLYGHVGCGKTTIINEVIKELGVAKIKFDANLVKNITVRHIVDFISHSLEIPWVVIDEVESMFSNIKTIIKDVKHLFKKAVFVFICDIRYNKRVNAWYNFHEIIIRQRNKEEIKRICCERFRNFKKETIKNVINKNYPDIRKILYNLSHNVIEQERQIYNGIYGIQQNIMEFILKNKSTLHINEVIKCITNDVFTGIPIIHENYLSYTPHIEKIANLLCQADIIYSKLYKNQRWEDIQYASLFGIVYPLSFFKNKPLKNSNLLSKINNLCSKQNRIKKAITQMDVSTYQQLLVLNYSNPDPICKTFNQF